ncbi:MAG: hypothetical protein ICCCNLDF_03066 [Planctomycetes bacterium]|nr:hypothetical protein [Planctomycetota bacterium]
MFPNNNRNQGYQKYGPVENAYPQQQQGYGQPYGVQGYAEGTYAPEGAYEGDLSDPAVAAFAKKVYAYFASALATATMAAFGGTMAVEHFVAAGNLGAVKGLWIGSLVTFFATYLIVVFSRKSRSPLKTGLLYVFASAAGFTLAPTLMYYVAAGMGMSIVMAFGIATVTFFGLTVYVLTTGKDFRSLGGMLVLGIFVVLGLSLMMLFGDFPNLLTQVAMGLGLLVFIGFTLYDTSRVVRDNYYNNDAVSAAINLLYDFVMLFRYALYFLGGSRD